MNVVFELRQRAGLTQELLARQAGVDRSMISRYETGRRSPRLDTLQRLAEAVNLEVVVSFRQASRRRGGGAVNRSTPATQLTFTWAGMTDSGVVRDHNEDAVHPLGSGSGVAGVVAVADGLGGHPGGDVASRLAIETVASGEHDDPAELIADARSRVVDHLMMATEEEPELIAMATTLTLAVLRPVGLVAVGHVGDSRLYLLREGVLRQITDDHTIGMDMVRSGKLSIDEAEQDPNWHVMNNWIGFERSHVETHELSVEPGDRVLLCTDGLSNMVDDPEIGAILGEPSSVGARAEGLIAAANEAGGLDNISVVVVDVVSPWPPGMLRPGRSTSRRSL